MKNTDRLLSIELQETKDILAELGRTKGDRIVIGFAAETNKQIGRAHV